SAPIFQGPKLSPRSELRLTSLLMSTVPFMEVFVATPYTRLSSPRRRGSRASDGTEALDSRLRGNDSGAKCWRSVNCNCSDKVSDDQSGGLPATQMPGVVLRPTQPPRLRGGGIIAPPVGHLSVIPGTRALRYLSRRTASAVNVGVREERGRQISELRRHRLQRRVRHGDRSRPQRPGHGTACRGEGQSGSQPPARPRADGTHPPRPPA